MENDDTSSFPSSGQKSPLPGKSIDQESLEEITNQLKEFGFRDAREFIQQNDPDIVQETIEEVEEIRKAAYDPEKN